MIYLKNNTETQAIYIPRQTVLGSGYIATTEKYEEGYNDGFKDGKEQQKDKLSNLNVTENGQYEREDGWNVVNVDVPDLNGSYNEGYEQGKTDGIDEQKAKLESINITENGVYSKEDGYNHIEVNVPSYEQGQADLAAKARVLNVTKNGTYLSKFSESIIPTTVTGVYADGTNFYSYAELNGKVFNTKIAATINSRLEFWYKGDSNIAIGGWNVIIGSGNFDDTRCFQVRYFAYKNNEICIEGASRVTIDNWDDTVWHHLIVSKAEGIWIDGEKKGDFSLSDAINGEFFINGIGYDVNVNANGCYGMIKIDDTIIIPTADGFLNTNTGELLEVVKDGSYNFTENVPIYAEGELYKTINVNVPDLNGSYDEGKTDGINEQKSKLESINITKNGTYNREDGWNVVTVDVSIKYNTIADIYGSPSDSTVTFKGFVALSFKYGSGHHILFTDHTGSIILKNCQVPLKVGDECLVTATLRRHAISHISALFNPSIEVLSSNNYVVMPTDAVELTNLDDLYIPNEDGYAEMKYLYADGTVVRTPSSNLMRIETDATRPGYISLRGDFSDWEAKLVEGDNIRVYMFTENASEDFWVTDIIKLGAEGGSCNLINPIVFSKEAGNTINAESVQIPTFVYKGNQYYNVDSFNLADIEEFKIHILFKPNNSGAKEPINVFGCENTDWDNTTFGARIYQGQIYFRMSGQDVASPYTENAWYDVEMGYNTIKRWVIVNGETLLDAEYASFNRPRQTLMIGAINSGGNAFRPFYGKIAAIYIESNGNQVWLLPKEEGTMGVYWNNRINSRNSISGDNNARFENDYISGDGMKSITWLGNLEDKWVTPSMNDRDSNGYIVVSPSEGYNGLKRTVINPQTIYNEGYDKGLVDATPSTIGGIKFGNSTFEECTFNLEGIEDFSYLFENCKNLRTAPSIQKAIKNARNMFRGCSSLTTAPTYNTSEATDLGGMYAVCHNLTSVGAVDCSSLPNAIIGWNREASIFDTNQYSSLTDFGGFLNLKQTVDLSGLIALSNNSIENIFNNLYDFSGNGETPNEIQGNITMSSFITDAVEQYRTIAESKGWTITIK